MQYVHIQAAGLVAERQHRMIGPNELESWTDGRWSVILQKEEVGWLGSDSLGGRKLAVPVDGIADEREHLLFGRQLAGRLSSGSVRDNGRCKESGMISARMQLSMSSVSTRHTVFRRGNGT